MAGGGHKPDRIQRNSLNSAESENTGKHNMLIVLLVILVLLSMGSLPTWRHSRDWGYYPSSGLGLVAVILIILLLLGRI